MSLDPLIAGAARAKGKRPWFFADPDVERVLAIAMSLAMELAVTRQRLDAIERLLEAKGLLARAEIEAFTPDVEAERERQAAMREYLIRVLRILLQDAEAARGQADVSIEAVIEELANN